MLWSKNLKGNVVLQKYFETAASYGCNDKCIDIGIRSCPFRNSVKMMNICSSTAGFGSSGHRSSTSPT